MFNNSCCSLYSIIMFIMVKLLGYFYDRLVVVFKITSVRKLKRTYSSSSGVRPLDIWIKLFVLYSRGNYLHPLKIKFVIYDDDIG